MCNPSQQNTLPERHTAPFCFVYPSSLGSRIPLNSSFEQEDKGDLRASGIAVG
jgi:hypothetical protein